MSGETDLTTLLKSMNPVLRQGEYVFCSVDFEDWLRLNPIGVFREEEGLTLILDRQIADQSNIPYASTFRLITLSVHSSLEAVGFLAAITSRLAAQGISVNAVSAYYHDHLFIPTAQADRVIELLDRFISDEKF
ncbi:ACT domain-containing protein [Leptolyngbya sp. AN03gr2]|uniref:ACT domain-containing protein n=1 Tax=unclassified Leptolyngbya TaxID=2650499 RepID=UPI003D30F0CE